MRHKQAQKRGTHTFLFDSIGIIASSIAYLSLPTGRRFSIKSKSDAAVSPFLA